MLGQDLIDQGLVADSAQRACFLNAASTPGSLCRFDCRTCLPSGGRPTRRIARSWVRAIGNVLKNQSGARCAVRSRRLARRALMRRIVRHGRYP